MESHQDVIVIGGGMAGLLTAYYLQEAGLEVLVLEANTVASGQTGRTTAKITSQHGLQYSQLIHKVGLQKATLYARANEEAIAEYERLIQDKGINCDFERVPAYLYARKRTQGMGTLWQNQREELLEMAQDLEALHQEHEAAHQVGIEAYFTEETELPFAVAGAVCFPNQAQFQPLEFVQAIAGQLKVLEHTQVLHIKGQRVITEQGEFQADNIVVATHYPLRNVPGFYFLRQHQERSYVLALEGCEKLHGMYYGVGKEDYSLRQMGERLLLGGSAKRTGHNQEGGAYAALEQAAEQYFPHGKEAARWSAQDCMPHDGIPFIGRYSIFTPHLYVATGFRKWGMTTSMVAAQILRDRICGKDNPYAQLFSPQRCLLRASISQLCTDVGVSVKGLVKGALHMPAKHADSLPKGHGGIVTKDGERYACYCDEEGELHCISARCPHLGCELAWNPDEKSWDCPCHGSRFDIDGKLLDNPARHAAKSK